MSTADQTPRIDPATIASGTSSASVSLFRLIAQVAAQPTETTLVLKSPSGPSKELITLNNVRLTAASRQYDTGKWYEFICRASDSGEVGFLVLDSVECVLREGEELSLDGVVALQQLSSKFPDIY